MARMPASFEADAKAAVGWVERHLPGHHETSAAPAAAATNRQENTMKMSVIAEDLKNGAVNADNWMHTVLEQHLPALVAEVERFQRHPIVQELELLGETLLPPGDIALITGIIRMAGKLAGQGAAAQQADTAQQADVPQVPAGQQDTAQADPQSDPRAR